MGIGDGYLGLVDLLSHHGMHHAPVIPLGRRDNTDCAENITEHDSSVECLVGFVAETTIQSVRRHADDSIQSWYYDVSSPRYP